jgi:hypothetical protein
MGNGGNNGSGAKSNAANNTDDNASMSNGS